MTEWRFYLAQSSDMSLLAELSRARSKRLSLGLNRPGTFSAVMSTEDENSLLVEKASTCIIAYRNGTAIWSGPIYQVQDDLAARQVSFTALGWFEIFNHRVMHMSGLNEIVYASQDSRAIAYDIVNDINTEGSTGITVGTNTTTINRSRTYQKFFNVGRALQELADIEAGYDWEIDPLTKVFQIYYPKGASKLDVVFGYNWGPDNCQNVRYSVDWTQASNQHIAKSIYYTQEVEDATSITANGVASDITQLPDMLTQAELTVFAAVEVALRKDGKIVVEMSPRPFVDGSSTPEPFVDYTIGDTVYLTTVSPRVNLVGQGLRVFGIDVDIDDQGMEKISSLKTSLA